MLLANLADVLQGLMPLILAIGWGVWQMIAAMNEARKAKRPAGKRAARGEGQPGGLKSEVDELLRQLKGQAEPAPPQPAADRQRRERPRRPRVEVLVDDQSPVVEREAPPRRLVSDQVASAKPRPQKSQRKQSAAQPSASARAEQATHLSERIAQADGLMEAQVHEKFDHEMGSLTDANQGYDQPYEKTDAAQSQPTTAESIAAMLRDPDNVRNAVILNEILRRPSI